MTDYIWIIGGTSGIGRATAEHYLKKGATVAISGSSDDNTKKVADEIKALPINCDVTNPESLQTARQQLNDTWPEINRIICLAAIYDPMQMTALNLPKVHSIINVNLTGAFNVADMAINYFKVIQSNSRKQFAYTASISGYTGLPNSQPYAATKAGVINMLESLHAECATKYPGIDIKMINPGFVETKLTDKNDFKMPFIIKPEEAADYIVKGLDKKRFEVHFPKKLTFCLKFLGVLPYGIKQRLVKKVGS